MNKKVISKMIVNRYTILLLLVLVLLGGLFTAHTFTTVRDNAEINENESVTEIDINHNSNSEEVQDNIRELAQEAQKQLVIKSNKRDIDKDSTKIYVTNYIINSLYNKYVEQYNSDDSSAILDKISKEVTNYMNEEFKE